MEDISVREANKRHESLLDNLYQFYLYDFSPMLSLKMDAQTGLFAGAKGEVVFDDPHKKSYLAYQGEDIVGFAMILAHDSLHEIEQFWIAPAFRRQGYGSLFAATLLTREPGLWQIFFLKQNESAAMFWRKVILDNANPITSWKENIIHSSMRPGYLEEFKV